MSNASAFLLARPRYQVSSAGDSASNAMPSTLLPTPDPRPDFGVAGSTSSSAPLSQIYLADFDILMRQTASLSNIRSASDLSPKDRMRFWWRSEPINAGAIVAGAIALTYIFIKLLAFAIPFIGVAVAWSADSGGKGGPPPFANVPARDAFDWFIVGLMGLVLAASMYAALYHKDAKRSSFGMDTTKMIVGFMIGFLSGRVRN